MQVVLTQADLERILKTWAYRNLPVTNQDALTVELVAGRGDNGIRATVDVVFKTFETVTAKQEPLTLDVSAFMGTTAPEQPSIEPDAPKEPKAEPVAEVPAKKTSGIFKRTPKPVPAEPTPEQQTQLDSLDGKPDTQDIPEAGVVTEAAEAQQEEVTEPMQEEDAGPAEDPQTEEEVTAPTSEPAKPAVRSLFKNLTKVKNS